MLNEITNAVLAAVTPLIVDLLVAILTIAFTALIGQLKKTQRLRHLTAAVELLQGATVDTVYANQSLIVDGLKALNGKLSQGEIEALRARTIERVRAKIGPAIVATIEAAGADVDAAILDTLEVALRQLKADEGTLNADDEIPADVARALSEREREEAKATLDEYFETECNKQAAELADEMA